MPSSKGTINLEAWSNFSPQERSNDFEYNLLIYKFKALLNEVKEFHELHADCSVARATHSLSHPDTISPLRPSNKNPVASATIALHEDGKFSRSQTSNPTNEHQQLISSGIAKKSLIFQHQNSVPPMVGSKHERPPLVKQNSCRDNDQQLGVHFMQLNDSNYNLGFMSCSTANQQTISHLNKPEAKQRNQVPSSKLLHSKSSERLDTLNNNLLISSLKSQDLSFRLNHFNGPVARNDKYLQNDVNIYDAVSPDDIPSDLKITNVAASVHNLNRISMQNKLESSKSTLGFSPYSNRNSSNVARGPISNSKSNPSWTVEGENYNVNNSHGSAALLDNNTNDSSSSLSHLAGIHNKEEDSNYANYVNIDFFLKRNESPSCDDLDEDSNDLSDDSDEINTNLSNSVSSDHNCEETSKEFSPREISHEIFIRNANKDSSPSSITPSSSGDLPEYHRNSSSYQMTQSSPPEVKHNESTSKLASFFNSNNRDSKNSASRKVATSSRDQCNKVSPPQQTLRAIHELSSSYASSERQVSLDPSCQDNDDSAKIEAHNTMRSFLSELNLSSADDIFEDKAQRRIVKESFAVEFCGRRKLRHLFLFNDVIVCAKYQASSKQKFTFDVKWYLNLSGISILDPRDANHQVKYDKEAIDNQILTIRTNLMLLRGQMQHIKRSKHRQPSKIIKKLKKKRTELEAELVLLLPHLPLVIKHVNGKKYTFFLSSNFDRNQWVESIKFLQSQLHGSKGSLTSPTSNELQAWIQTCRKNLNPSLGTFLMRSNCDDDLLYGDLYINLNKISGLTKPGNYYFCFEVDSYGHFSQKASSALSHIEVPDYNLNEEYVFPLDGAHTLRILLYQDLGASSRPSVIGKAHIELSRSWFLEKPVEKLVEFNMNLNLLTQLSYSSSELLSMRVPHNKLCPVFGMDITQVCKKEKTEVPLLIQLCVNEVERRGMREVGIYRMSGTSTDIQRLKKSFETNPYIAELLLRDIDINSVTGFLKTYLREMPEGLFSNKLYPRFVAAFNIPQSESLERTKKMLELLHMVPAANQQTIIYLVTHLVKVNKYESHNKMSLTNLATVLGPNILRPPSDPPSSNLSDPFTAVVIGSMSQAGILYFFLNRKFSNLPLTELDSSELNQDQESSTG